jgi:Arc/MetJ family transcription regulator
MRANIEIDDALLAEAQRLSGQSTKKATVEKTLELLVRLERQKDVRKAFGKFPWDGDFDQSRRGRRLG